MTDERTKALEQVAEHFEARSRELDEIARRYGELDIGAPLLRAQAMAMREAAVYARTEAANGKVKAVKPRTPRGRPPKSSKEAKVLPQADSTAMAAATTMTRPRSPVGAGFESKEPTT